MAEHVPGWQRTLWFVGLWAGGVITLGAIAYLIRWALGIG